MDGAELELQRRSKFLSSLIQKKKSMEQQEQTERLNVKVRASDMPLALLNKAFKCARDQLDYMTGKLDSKRLALALKKEFDSTYGPAWHCIVGTSFGSYVTYSLGGSVIFLLLPENPTDVTERSSGKGCTAMAKHNRRKPLNFRLSDEILMKIASKVNGRLKTLTFMCCAKITDDGLERVIDQNPLISKLHIPGCTGLTPNGVITAVQKLSDSQQGLKSIQINGIANMKKEHLERIQYYLQTNPKLQQIHPTRQPLLYHNYRRFQGCEEHGRVQLSTGCFRLSQKGLQKETRRFNDRLSDVRVMRSEV
ncbi:O-Glycosyl hydrolases family 17 protein [Hibiscus syriacus]|uniref:O-Glycosyl hydrolases family 17 protein n=1 Tax=Hibiscus syriacus TaxID=106335 RepID=A0A6A3A5S7_HIBSY|nr:O-Glycosyl hydrolases family 17 protein [Hibiscus syriacus]